MEDPSTPQQGDGEYLLFRGGLASARLTAQHFVMIERQGWMLHPDIEKSLAGKSNVKIADLATGNGIWALDISEEYPDANIVGLDISPEQFPPSFTRPKTVTFELYNFFDPVPDTLRNQFDVIHIRLIVAAIYDKDTDTLLNNILSMLKPGGYLQWDDLTGPGALMTDSTLKIDRNPKSYMQRLHKVTGFLNALDFFSTVPTRLAEKGFIDALGYEPPMKISLLPHESEVMVWSVKELIQFIGQLPKEGAKEEMARAAEELEAEMKAGKLGLYSWQVAIGRKPGSG